MRKINQANRKFFLKWLPFNFCDRHCERCGEMRKDCKIYLEDVQFKAQCVMEGKNPDDPEVVFEHIAKTMAQTMRMLEENLKKEGIKITKKDRKKYDRKVIFQKKAVKNHPLYKKCCDLTGELHRFLLVFQNSFQDKPWLAASLGKEMEEIFSYSPLIVVKATRALSSQIEEKEEKITFSRPDSLISGALGFFSLKTVENSLKSIREFLKGSEMIWVLKINALLKKTEETQTQFKKAFPQIEKFADKIIFHGKY